MLLFEEETLAGPVDERALLLIERSHALDPSYRKLIFEFHGGIPVQQYIRGMGAQYRVGRFLTILKSSSPLPEPFQPHFEYSKQDSRIVRSVAALVDGEFDTSRALFYGQRLTPFAALYWGEENPDEMCLDRATVSLLCFDYGTGASRPPVVVWHAQKAIKCYREWEDNGCPTETSDSNVPQVDYSRFTERIAENFDQFAQMMQSEP